MSDLFHELVPDELIDRVFAVMALTPWHTYQVLTKRPERMLAYISAPGRADVVWTDSESGMWAVTDSGRIVVTHPQWPLPNVWLGTSVENQRWAAERIPLLLQTPAAVRFISAEPLLGPLLLEQTAGIHWLGPPSQSRGMNQGLDWVIAGGESGPKRRPCDLDWLRSLRDQCQVAGVPFFFKQASAARPGQPSGVADLDAWKELPR